ncbi:MAG TPA: hypothetical protein VK936_04375 [Longimicrobiales bacterium]|nr:hypothetical protein [Longimicrobiales bacterium]
MKSFAGKHPPAGYENPVHHIDWTQGIGQPAGVYWLAGRSVIAAHGSTAETCLVAEGAVLVATLRFDADPLESRHPGRRVERLPLPLAATAMLLSPAVN